MHCGTVLPVVPCDLRGACRLAHRWTSPPMLPSISAFFPAYNDSGTIASMVVVADMALRKLTDDYEVIVVNDGSPDHCGEILAELQTRFPRLRVITHEHNRGYGGALRSGFANASK